MDGYGHLIEDDAETPNVGAELAELGFQAGYGRALLDVHHSNSSDAVGDRILAAAEKMRSADLWDSRPKDDGQ